MECKKVRDQLITEYADEELASDKRLVIDQHLAACPDCREFFVAVQKTTVTPFREAATLKPDDVVWQRIQERVAKKESWGARFWERMDIFISRFPLPVPLMRAAFVTALILVAVVLARWPSGYVDPVYGYMSEQMTFMEELGAGNTDLMNGDLKDYDVMFNEMLG
jgi:anti-sigma factor RsiW